MRHDARSTSKRDVLLLAFKTGAFAAAGLACAETLSGCLVAGYSSGGGFFLWPGSIGLLVVVLLLIFLLRRGR
jgi:hypothetical protein